MMHSHVDDFDFNQSFHTVLILVVMDDALAQYVTPHTSPLISSVLILVVMDDALALCLTYGTIWSLVAS